LEIPREYEGLDLVSSVSSLPEFAFIRCYSGAAVRSVRFKFIRSTYWGWRKQRPSRMPIGTMLFDLSVDRGETTDVSELYPKQARRMIEFLAKNERAYKNKRASAKTILDEGLPPETRESLEALGYIQ
jgi:hypothetical protein